MMQPLLFVVFVAVFGAPGYLLARRAYSSAASNPLPGECAAVGGLISFAILGLIALPAYGFDFSLLLVLVLFVAIAAVLVVATGAHHQILPVADWPGQLRSLIARHGVLLIAAVGLAALTVPFARYFPDGADMLYFVGVTRKYIDAGHVFGANVIYGNGTPDSLNGANLWLLFCALAGWVAGHVEPVRLFGWLAALLGAAWLLVQRLFFRACGADDRTSQWMAVFVTAAAVFYGGYLLHDVDVDLLINQSHRAAYPKIVMYNALVPLLVFFLIRFFETRDRWYLLWTVIGGMVTLQIHPLESAWLGCALLAILVFLMLFAGGAAFERNGIAAATALFVAASAPYLLLKRSAIGRIYDDKLMATLTSPDRLKDVGVHIVVSAPSLYHVDLAYVGSALLLSLVAVVVLAVLRIPDRALLVLGAALLATIPVGVWSVSAPRAGRLLMIDNLERLTVYGSNLQPYLLGAALALLLDRFIGQRVLRRAVVIATLGVASAGIVIAHRGLLKVDYLADSEVHDLHRELQSPLVAAMRAIPPGSVIFNGDQVRALRQIVALTDHYPYLLEPYKRNAVGLSGPESTARVSLWSRVMDPAASPIERRRLLAANGIQYLLVPRRLFASVESSPMFEWIALSRAGEDREEMTLGRIRTDRELRSMLNGLVPVLQDRTAPFDACYGRLWDAMQLAAATGESTALKNVMASFSERPLGQSYALLDLIRRNGSSDLKADATQRLNDVLRTVSLDPRPLSISAIQIEGLKGARTEYFPERLNDANPMTGIVITGRNDSFNVIADVGSLNVISGVEVTTAFLNENYALPSIGVFTSIDHAHWQYCGDLHKAFEKTGFFDVGLHAVAQVARYVRLAVPASSGNMSITEIRVRGRRLPGVS